jgi:hypothetical protein
VPVEALSIFYVRRWLVRSDEKGILSMVQKYAKGRISGRFWLLRRFFLNSCFGLFEWVCWRGVNKKGCSWLKYVEDWLGRNGDEGLREIRGAQ